MHPGHPPLDRVAHGARPAPGCATAELVLPARAAPACAIGGGGDGHTGELGEGWTEVDVFDQVVEGSSVGNSRAGDDQRHMDVGIEGSHLSRHQAVFTHVIAVVGAEDEIGVLRWPLAATAVCRSPIIRSTASTDCARLRKSRSIAAMSLLGEW